MTRTNSFANRVGIPSRHLWPMFRTCESDLKRFDFSADVYQTSNYGKDPTEIAILH